MRCPRCHRLVVRGLRSCAGCGADLPGVTGAGVSRLERPTEKGPTGPLEDFSLHGEPVRRARSPRTSVRRARLTRGVSPRLDKYGPFGTERLPQKVAETARPFSVVRPTPIAARVHHPPAPPTLEPTFAFDPAKASGNDSAEPTAKATHLPQLLSRRFVAGALDVGILVGIKVAVVYFTLRLAGLPMASVSELPPVPLLAFLLLFDFGYLSVLTAFGGQTIGKMATGLRVESGQGAPVTLGGALTRTAAYGVSILPAGLGLLGVFARSKRPLHDLLADTRVVKV